MVRLERRTAHWDQGTRAPGHQGAGGREAGTGLGVRESGTRKLVIGGWGEGGWYTALGIWCRDFNEKLGLEIRRAMVGELERGKPLG